MIESRTTRPPRTPDERGHTFVTEEEFNTYPKEDMIAFTQFGEYNYCCLISDVRPGYNVYVIDEFGLLYLREHFSNEFHIFAIRIFAPDGLRRKYVSKERMERDEGKFTLSQDDFDSFLENVYIEHDTEEKVDAILSRISKQYNIPIG